MHVIPHFTRALFHSDYRGTQLLSRHIPIYNFLRLSSRWRTRYSEVVYQKDNQHGDDYATDEAR